MEAKQYKESRPLCPQRSDDGDCDGQVTWKGQVERVGLKVTSDDVLDPVPLVQCLCKIHGRSRQYPEFVLPHKHYVALVVDGALESRSSGQPLEAFCSEWHLHERSTAARWIEAFHDRLPTVIDLVQRLLARLPMGVRSRGDPQADPFPSALPAVYSVVWAALSDVCSAYSARGLELSPRSHLALFS